MTFTTTVHHLPNKTAGQEGACGSFRPASAIHSSAKHGITPGGGSGSSGKTAKKKAKNSMVKEMGIGKTELNKAKQC